MHYSFDFDYTLADSSEGSIICYNYALREMGYAERSREEIKKTIGLSLPKTFGMFVPDLSEKVLDRLFRLFMEKADEVMLDCINFYDTAEITLSGLKRRGHFISIVSTKFKNRIEAALKRDKMINFVDYIVGGDCVNRFKPDPEGLIKAIDFSGISAENAYYIGEMVNAPGEQMSNLSQ